MAAIPRMIATCSVTTFTIKPGFRFHLRPRVQVAKKHTAHLINSVYKPRLDGIRLYGSVVKAVMEKKALVPSRMSGNPPAYLFILECHYLASND